MKKDTTWTPVILETLQTWFWTIPVAQRTKCNILHEDSNSVCFWYFDFICCDDENSSESY